MLDYVENTVTGSPDVTVSKYNYTTDELGRRTNVIHSGTAFIATHNLVFGYNTRNELTAADRWQGTDQTNHTAAPFAYDYAYDPIGNRMTFTADDSATSTSYSRNNVNQYTSTTDPNEAFDYDDDGNMVEDGTYTYVWDGENRLREVYPTNASNDDKKLVFDYDYMSRRVRKRIFLYDDGWPLLTSTPDTDLKFVYDQWNVIMVLNGKASDAIQSKYTWGLDMSGLAGSGVAPGVSPVVSGIHGAGGISGLLAGEEMDGTHEGIYWFFYDGNGNVCQALDATNTAAIKRVAHYEYDPYGNVIVSDNDTHDPDGTLVSTDTGYALANPFRFSTKWFDESGLGYWGYRYYSPRLGRWINRDPIGYLGSEANLYCYGHNSPLTWIDLYGLQSHMTHTVKFGIGPVKLIFAYIEIIYDDDVDICTADVKSIKVTGFPLFSGRVGGLSIGVGMEFTAEAWGEKRTKSCPCGKKGEIKTCQIALHWTAYKILAIIPYKADEGNVGISWNEKDTCE